MTQRTLHWATLAAGLVFLAFLAVLHGELARPGLLGIHTQSPDWSGQTQTGFAYGWQVALTLHGLSGAILTTLVAALLAHQAGLKWLVWAAVLLGLLQVAVAVATALPAGRTALSALIQTDTSLASGGRRHLLFDPPLGPFYLVAPVLVGLVAAGGLLRRALTTPRDWGVIGAIAIGALCLSVASLLLGSIRQEDAPFLRDTYYDIAALHLLLVLVGFFVILYLSQRVMAWTSCALTLIYGASMLVFLERSIALGTMGMPRGYPDYPSVFATSQMVIAIAAGLGVAAVLLAVAAAVRRRS